jgi:CHAT domain-containing protein/Tfp pilus assembly protein PilF
LKLGATVDRAIRGGTGHTYILQLRGGDLVEAAVEQIGIDISVRVGPEGGHELEVDELATSTGRETIVVVARQDGDHRIVVQPADETAAEGRYLLTIGRLGPATPADLARAKAAELRAEGNLLRRQPSAAGLADGVRKLNESLEIWRLQGDVAGEASTLLLLAQAENELGLKSEALADLTTACSLLATAGNRTAEGLCLALLGSLHDDQGEPAAALAALEQALDRFRELDDRKGVALSLVLLGSVHDRRGRKQEALRYYEEGLALSRQAGERFLQSLALNDLGRALTHLDRPQAALGHFFQALKLVEALGDRKSQAWVLSNMGVVFTNLGDPARALDYYGRSLPIRLETGDRYGEALTLHNMAAVYTDTGELQSAMEAFRRALTLWRDVGDKRSEARTLIGLGKLYSVLGESESALSAYQQALPLTEAAQDKEGTAMAWLNLGWEHTAREDYALAEEELARALALWREVGSHRREAATLLNLADLELARGQAERALAYARQALEIRRQVQDRRGEAIGLHSVGKCFADLGDLAQAIESFREALPLRAEARDRPGEAATRHQLARALRKSGELAEALRQVETALRLVEQVRGQILSAEAKASFLATRDTYARFHIELLQELARRRGDRSFERRAFEANELRRARGLRDALVLSGAEVRRGIGADLRVLLREAEMEAARLDLRLRTEAGRGAQAEVIAALAHELDDRLLRLSEIRAQVAQQSPQYAGLMQPGALTAQEIQKLVSQTESLLVELMLGEERSLAWVVGRDGLEVIELPPAHELEVAARGLYEAVLRSREPLGRTAFEAEAFRLAGWILAPIEGRLRASRLLVVADGALQFVPFGLLPDPTTSDRDYEPLISRREVVSLPSAAVLAELRARQQARPVQASLAVIADPVVEPDDPRLQATRSSPGGARTLPAATPLAAASAWELTRAVEAVEESGLTRLPFAAREAQAIAGLIPSGPTLQATGLAASRSLVTAGALSSHRILHFATHALLNTRHPALSGLVLSLYDEQGREQDGFLRVQEIYNLDLTADLVVLSACRTALGKDVKGEGLIGLTRAFFYAGAGGVISSLWKVDDRATAELMQRFYRKLLKEGLPPSAALREAQLSMWREPAWQAPYYWAGFVFQGDWERRPVPEPLGH